MSKANRTARQQAAQRLAAARRKEQQRRQRLWLAGGAVGLVVLVVAVLVVVRLATGGSDEEPQQASTTASAQVLEGVTNVPQTALDQVGTGTVDGLPTATTGQPALTSNGKPLVVYIGAEYCPFCAAQRWPMVVALSRFGTFTGLKTAHSASDDVYPNTATLSFHGATYSSQYLEFQGVETEDSERQPLDTLTAQQEQLMATYDPQGSIPFIDFGNKYTMTGASFSPELLKGKTAEEIAAALSDPNSDIAKAVLGSANAYTYAMCQLTNGQPANVCTSAGVTAYAGKF